MKRREIKEEMKENHEPSDNKIKIVTDENFRLEKMSDK